MRAFAAPDLHTLRACLAERIRDAQDGDPLATVEVVAPSRLAVRELKPDLARRTGGLLGVHLLSLPLWVDRLVAPAIARAGGRRLGEPGYERLAARVVDEVASSPAARNGPFARARETPGLSRAVAAALSDLQEGGFNAGSLVDWRESREALRRELADALAAMEDALATEGLWDRRRKERTACQELTATPAGAEEPPVILIGFHDLTPVQRALVATAARDRDVTLLVPGPGPPGARETGEAAVAPLLEWIRACGAPTEFRARESAPSFGLDEGLFDAPRLIDPGEELEVATHDSESSEVRAIARRIRIEVEANGRRFSDFVVTTSGDGPSPTLFRRIFRSAGVPLEDRAGLPANRTEAGRRALLLARAVSPREPTRDAEALAFLPPADDEAAVETATRAFLTARTARVLTERFAELHASRFGEPPGPPVLEALEGISLALGDRALAPSRLAGMLAGALASARDLGDPDPRAVLLVARDASRFVRRAFAFHAGLVEGALLRPAREDALLPDRLRRDRNEAHEHEGRRLRVTEDRRDERPLLARFALEAATERTVLSWSVRSRIGTEARNASPLLVDLARRRGDTDLPAPGRDRDEARAHPVDATDLHVATFGGGHPPGEDDLSRVLADPEARHLPAALLATEARFAPPLGPWDGVLHKEEARATTQRLLAGRVWSASALDKMASCPFSMLVSLLKLDDDTVQEDDFTPLERGSHFHTLLHELAEDLAERGVRPVTPETLDEALLALDARVARLHAKEVVHHRPAQRAGRAATLAALRNDAAVLLAREAWRTPAERTTPLRSEVPFGPADENGAPSFPLPGGRGLPYRGRVDRLDETPDGDLVVVDFKTGVPRGKDHELRGTLDGKVKVLLQAPLYLHAIEHATGRKPARAVLAHATVDHGFQEIVFTSADLEAARDEIGRLLAHLEARAQAGWFPCTPGTRCCRRDLALACGPAVVARFRRKEDPELEAHLARVAGKDES